MKKLRPLHLKATSVPSTFMLHKEDSVELQNLRNEVFKINKVKKGRAFQLNAVFAFNRAVKLSKKKLSLENLLSNFWIN